MSKYIFVLLILFGFAILTSFKHSLSSTLNSIEIADSLDLDRKKYTDLVLSTIKGKEKMRVDSVFTNLKVLSGFPAQNLVLIMNAYSRALGVSCGHCHNTSDFSSDEVDKKDITRAMVGLSKEINDKLKTISGLSARPIVNCTTCHRGDLKPAFQFPAK